MMARLTVWETQGCCIPMSSSICSDLLTLFEQLHLAVLSTMDSSITEWSSTHTCLWLDCHKLHELICPKDCIRLMNYYYIINGCRLWLAIYCKNWRRKRPGNEVRPRAAERDSGNENWVANLFFVDLTCSTAVALAETFQAKMALVSDWQNLVCCLISMNFRFSLVCLARLSPCLATRD